MSFAFHVHFTRNMLSGQLAGCQLAATVRTESAFDAARLSSGLNTSGVHTDRLTEGMWTAHNINIRSTESELDDLIQPVDFRVCEDELLDLADLLEAA
jgi:hypothetical protein